MVSAKDARPVFSGLPTPRQLRSWALAIILVMLAVSSGYHYIGGKEKIAEITTNIEESTSNFAPSQDPDSPWG